MEYLPAVVGDWTAVFVPCLALWVFLGVQFNKSTEYRGLYDALYLAAMLVVAAITLRTMCTNNPWWLIHTASLGVMIVAGVLPRREQSEEAAHFIAS